MKKRIESDPQSLRNQFSLARKMVFKGATWIKTANLFSEDFVKMQVLRTLVPLFALCGLLDTSYALNTDLSGPKTGTPLVSPEGALMVPRGSVITGFPSMINRVGYFILVDGSDATKAMVLTETGDVTIKDLSRLGTQELPFQILTKHRPASEIFPSILIPVRDGLHEKSFRHAVAESDVVVGFDKKRIQYIVRSEKPVAGWYTMFAVTDDWRAYQISMDVTFSRTGPLRTMFYWSRNIPVRFNETDLQALQFFNLTVKDHPDIAGRQSEFPESAMTNIRDESMPFSSTLEDIKRRELKAASDAMEREKINLRVLKAAITSGDIERIRAGVKLFHETQAGEAAKILEFAKERMRAK
ncbi:MAG: hypothetical protein C5B49_14900 [Bdellovibrio sp.]|nr:MAG: hypothetical protein C5B49_14900 [Bdellovibrio sp.]